MMNSRILIWRHSLFLTCICLIPTGLKAEILDHFPEQLNEESKYIIYLHGRIIEDKGIRPTHPKFGVYEFEALAISFAKAGYTVIRQVRKANTKPQQYADYVSKQLRRYRSQSNTELNLVGFSKGGVITLLVSSQMNDTDIRYAILAACWQSITKRDMDLSGHILSLHDLSDSVASCQPLADKSNKIVDFHVRTFDTGKSHGLFFKPYPTWQKPLFEWLKR
ncbi:MAG: hypothetical protein JKY88_00220 [Pseudomonadales bacterium]|nr:hypothetical protein [Pseudomonadales bacterium]